MGNRSAKSRSNQTSAESTVNAKRIADSTLQSKLEKRRNWKGVPERYFTHVVFRVQKKKAKVIRGNSLLKVEAGTNAEISKVGGAEGALDWQLSLII